MELYLSNTKRKRGMMKPGNSSEKECREKLAGSWCDRLLLSNPEGWGGTDVKREGMCDHRRDLTTGVSIVLQAAVASASPPPASASARKL